MFTHTTRSTTYGRRLLLAGLFSLATMSSLLARDGDWADDDRWHGDGRGAVFALTNAPSGNAVLAYRRGTDGSLRLTGTYPTGGSGTGAGLNSQGAVVVTDDRRFVLAVNAGSSSVSVFRIRQDRLQLVDTKPSGGVMPTSIAVRNGLVVVLNAGEPNSITGFRLGPHGRLSRIPGFTGLLSASQSSPGKVGFSHDGDTIIVTERATNVISTFAVDDEGIEGPYITPSAGPTPYGFAVGSRNTVLVSEAGAGGGASTYRVKRDRLDVVTSNIMTGQRAACWAVLTPDGRFGYVSNAGTGTITGFALARNGAAVQLDADGVTAMPGGNPTDMAISDDGRYLYARNGNLTSIVIYHVSRDGLLTALRPLSGTPAGIAGLAAF